MVAIVNVTGPQDLAGDEHRYEVRINRQPITRFTHRRSDGLAVCLRKAAEAVERKDRDKLLRLLMEVGDDEIPAKRKRNEH